MIQMILIISSSNGRLRGILVTQVVVQADDVLALCHDLPCFSEGEKFATFHI